MTTENFPSPNAIPPRTSSTGLNIGLSPAAKPVLKPVSEAAWISHGKKSHTPATSLDMSKSIPNGTGHPGGVTHPNGASWSGDKEKILLGPYDYLFNQPGKDIRKQLIAAFNAWLEVPEKSLTIITKVIGMLHTSSLLYVSPSLQHLPPLTKAAAG